MAFKRRKSFKKRAYSKGRKRGKVIRVKTSRGGIRM